MDIVNRGKMESSEEEMNWSRRENNNIEILSTKNEKTVKYKIWDLKAKQDSQVAEFC